MCLQFTDALLLAARFSGFIVCGSKTPELCLVAKIVHEIECNRATVEPRYTKICQGTGKTYLFAILRFGPSPEYFSTTGATNTS